MKLKTVQKSKSAQEIQDDIFRKMSADRKVEVGSMLWKLAKNLAGHKISGYGRTNRPAPSTGPSRSNS